MQEAQPKAAKSNNLLKQILPVVIALGLLAVAFNKVDPAKIWSYSQAVKPLPVVLVIVASLVSVLLRAYRWIFLLEPVAKKRVSLFNSFYAVILGYAVNIAIPRGGEVARLLSICKEEGLPWAGVLPTMLIDRMLDIGLLASLLGATLLVLPKDMLATMPWLVPGGIGLLLGAVLGLVVLPHVGALLKFILNLNALKSRLPEKLNVKLLEIAEQFNTGTEALKSPVKYPIIALLSVLIWACYWLNLYFMVQSFSLEKEMNACNCLIVFAVGSAGVLIPTPGSAGSYHVLVANSVKELAHIPYEQALAFATVMHFICFVVVNLIPAALLFFFKKFRDGAKNPGPPPIDK